MIIGLLGPSCSGKTFLLGALKELAGFHIPVSITTRSKRKGEECTVEHVSRSKFMEMRDQGMLCLVAEVFGNLYAYHMLNTGLDCDVAVEIVRENINELSSYGGIVIGVMPDNPEVCLNRILEERQGETLEYRVNDLSSESYGFDLVGFDYIFRNRYNQDSIVEFLSLVASLRAV